MTNADVIVAALRQAGRPLSDAELVTRTGIRPHQQVNQICRRLAAERRIVRSTSVDGTIRNSVLISGEQPARLIPEPRPVGDATSMPTLSVDLHADVVLVGCSKAKQSHPASAEDLYVSDGFRKRRSLARSLAPEWFILSAEHGLVQPGEWLAPYDLYLDDTTTEYRAAWGEWCVARLTAKSGGLAGRRVLILAPRAYASAVRVPLERAGAIPLEPLAGLRQGEQGAWLSQQISLVGGEPPRFTDATGPTVLASGDARQDVAIRDELLAYRLQNERLHESRLGYAESAEADALLVSDPFAFLLGVLLDEGVPAERAWTGPYLLKQRLGHLDPQLLQDERTAVFEAVNQQPKVHRYIDIMTDAIVRAAARVCAVYGGDAARIWAPGSTASEVDTRFQQFHKIGPKKAAMAVELLISHFGVVLADHTGTNVAYDVHVRRVFLRTGLVARDSIEEIKQTARRLNPDRPGLLDLPTWLIGRRWCDSVAPECPTCPLTDVCRKLTSRNV